MSVCSDRKRRPFTVTESAAIWKYIISNDLQNHIHRRSVWQAMEAAGITTHSAESMRSHFRQVLFPQLNQKPFDHLIQRSFRGRRHEYTERDDQAILNYIVQNQRYRETKSRKFWKDLERQKVTSHSAESMRNRFRRTLLYRFLSELRCVLTLPEYEDFLRSLGPSSRSRSLFSMQLYNGDDEYTISETSMQMNDTVNGSSLVSHGPLEKDIASQRADVGISSCSSVAHSTPHKSPANSCQMTRENGKLVSSFRNHSTAVLGPPQDRVAMDTTAAVTPTATPTRHRPADVRNLIREIRQSSNLITDDTEVYVLLHMTNGSVIEAENFLRTGRRHPDLPPGCSPPLWTLEADTQLTSTNVDVIRELIKRFGTDEVCQRIAFLSEI